MKNLATFLFAVFFTFSQVAFIPQEANAGRIGSAYKAYKSFSMPKARVSVPRTTYRAPARAWKPTRTMVSYKPSRIAAKPAMPKATIKLGNKTVSGKQAVTIKSNQARAKKYASLYNKPAKTVKFPANTKNLKIDKKAASALNKNVKKTSKLIKKADKRAKQQEQVKINTAKGLKREKYVQKKLEGTFNPKNGHSVQQQRYLYDKNGKIVRDAKGSARRLDHVIVDNKTGKAKYVVETTSKTANKAPQIRKEREIIARGGKYIKDTNTGQLVPIDEARSIISRRL